MKAWKTAALAAALVTAAALGAALTPAARAQVRVARTQAPRALEVLTGGTRIGVSVRDVEDSDAKGVKPPSTGIVVEEVSADSPAEKAGVRKADVFVEFDGERVRSVRQFTRLVQETPAGRTVQAAVLRDGQRTTLSITPRDGGARFSFDGSGDLADVAAGDRVVVKVKAPRKDPGEQPFVARQLVDQTHAADEAEVETE